ncbi:DUF6702 family protein [Gramella sp. KN1008]|uniref:DUF6702 family protein n=1 Tax=Gramella sp. KN1008 TaxID=2529298 RepID=UPI00103D320F|nr:DUF6702 family protein [Gramella sp. KN1008]TBW27534.1 hypothetical protein EZJ28_11225 [Gramella sp. KN1008]
MKKTLALLFAFIFLTSFSAGEHETYLSVTEVEYDREDKALQIVARVFIDDFENVLSKRYGQAISLSYENDLKTHKDIMARYVSQKLQISVDGKSTELDFVGSKFDADQIVLFIEAPEVEDFKKIRVENLILTDLFDAQKNIVHVKKDDVIESMLLMKANGSKTISF